MKLYKAQNEPLWANLGLVDGVISSQGKDFWCLECGMGSWREFMASDSSRRGAKLVGLFLREAELCFDERLDCISVGDEEKMVTSKMVNPKRNKSRIL